jgi:hypothetical protein
MSLNLGLESLGFATEAYSYEQVLQSQIAAMEAVQSFEHAMFDLANTAKDVRNFREIVSSLNRHSSSECIAFASELLGISLEADNAAAATTAAAKETDKKEEKAKGALGRMWDRICKFFKDIWDWMKRTFGRLFNVASLVDDKVRNPKVKVTWTLQQLNAIDKALDGFAIKALNGNYASLNTKALRAEGKDVEIDLAKTEDAKKYLRAMLDLQGKLYDCSTEIRQKIGYIDQKGRGAKLSQYNVTISRLLMKIAKTLQSDANRLQNASHAASVQVTKSFAGATKPENPA